MVNTVLCAIAAESFKAFSDAIEAGAKPAQVAADALNKHWKCIFNGNGYAEEWPQEAVNKGMHPTHPAHGANGSSMLQHKCG